MQKHFLNFSLVLQNFINSHKLKSADNKQVFQNRQYNKLLISNMIRYGDCFPRWSFQKTSIFMTFSQILSFPIKTDTVKFSWNAIVRLNWQNSSWQIGKINHFERSSLCWNFQLKLVVLISCWLQLSSWSLEVPKVPET